jgi:hypothetical protein
MGNQHSLYHLSKNNKIDSTIAIQSLSGMSQDLIHALLRLHAEIIHEIVKYDQGCNIKLAITCKELYGTLQENLKRIRKIMENNNKLYEVKKAINNIIYENQDVMDRGHVKAFIKISDNILDNLQCVNCEKLRRDRTFSFY